MVVKVVDQLIQPPFKPVTTVLKWSMHRDRFRELLYFFKTNDLMLILNSKMVVMNAGKFLGNFILFVKITWIITPSHFIPDTFIKLCLIYLHLIYYKTYSIISSSYHEKQFSLSWLIQVELISFLNASCYSTLSFPLAIWAASLLWRDPAFGDTAFGDPWGERFIYLKTMGLGLFNWLL